MRYFIEIKDVIKLHKLLMEKLLTEEIILEDKINTLGAAEYPIDKLHCAIKLTEIKKVIKFLIQDPNIDTNGIIDNLIKNNNIKFVGDEMKEHAFTLGNLSRKIKKYTCDEDEQIRSVIEISGNYIGKYEIKVTGCRNYRLFLNNKQVKLEEKKIFTDMTVQCQYIVKQDRQHVFLYLLPLPTSNKDRRPSTMEVTKRKNNEKTGVEVIHKEKKKGNVEFIKRKRETEKIENVRNSHHLLHKKKDIVKITKIENPVIKRKRDTEKTVIEEGVKKQKIDIDNLKTQLTAVIRRKNHYKNLCDEKEELKNKQQSKLAIDIQNFEKKKQSFYKQKENDTNQFQKKQSKLAIDIQNFEKEKQSFYRQKENDTNQLAIDIQNFEKEKQSLYKQLQEETEEKEPTSREVKLG